MFAIDYETYATPSVTMLTAAGKKKNYWRRNAPRSVCLQVAGRGAVPKQIEIAVELGLGLLERGVQGWAALVDRVKAPAVLLEILAIPDSVIIGAYIAFDLAVACAQDERLLFPIFMALAQDRVICVEIRQKLIAIAMGTMQEDGRESYSLSSLVASYLSIDRSAGKKGDDIWRVRYHELDGVPVAQWPRAAVQYALDDALDTLLVAIAQAPIGRPRMGFDGMPVTTERGGVINEAPQVRADFAMYLMTCWGLRVDPEVYEKWGEEIRAEVEHAEEVGRLAGFVRPNGKVDQKRLRELVEESARRFGRDPILTPKSDKFPNGQVKIASEVLIDCDNIFIDYLRADGTIEQVPPLVVWGESSFLRTMKQTFYDPAGLGIDWAMLYRFNVLVATGRTSGRGPNMQNPPREGSFRDLFVARPGRVFCSTDYSALELRTLAQIHWWFLGTSELREAFMRGEDPHIIFAAKLAGVTLEEFKVWYTPGHPKYKAAKGIYRQCAKVANFGIPGGLGAESLVQYAWDTYVVDLERVVIELGKVDFTLPREPKKGRRVRSVLTPEQAAIVKHAALEYAKHLIREWKAAWAEAPQYMRLIAEACSSGDFTYLQPVAWRQRGGCGYCDGNNTGFQGQAADGGKEGAWRLSVLCYLPPAQAVQVLEAQAALAGGWERLWESPPEKVEEMGEALWGVRPVLFIHDEVIAEGPLDTAHLWGPAQAQVLVEAMKMWTPDVPQVVEPALMRRWTKSAEPRYDQEGRLIPWD